MNFGEKIETIDNKIEQYKGRYNLGRQKDQFQLYHQENFGKYKSLTGENILLET